MLSGNVNTISVIIVGMVLVALMVSLFIQALLNDQNTQTLSQAVRTALIQTRDDSARINSKTIYPLNVLQFEKQVKGSKLKETGNHRTGNYHFYYLLQNGQLVDTSDYRTAVKKNILKRGHGKTTLIKGVTVDVDVDAADARHSKGRGSNEAVYTAKNGDRRYSVTYLIDGGTFNSKNQPGSRDANKSDNEAGRSLPAGYQDPSNSRRLVSGQRAYHTSDGKTTFNHNMMTNLTDD